MPFPSEELVEVQISGESDFTLLKTFTYHGKHESFLVPAGQTTDFASVPKFMTWLLPRYGKWTKAAILHDHLWRTGKVSKKDADGIFRRALRELDVPLHKRWAMWSAVRLTSIFKYRGLPGTPLKDMLLLMPLWVALTAFVVVPAAVVLLFSLVFAAFGKVLSLFDRS